MTEYPFSFEALDQALGLDGAVSDAVPADDGTLLSYGYYLPAAPRAAILFYHGAGAHGRAGYQFIGSGLETQFATAVYLPDIRGHGASQGRRGDAANPQQVWADVSVLIRRIRETHPGLPLILGGHSSGAGMVLNYASWPEREKVDGYVLLAPQLGPHAATDRPQTSASFARVDDGAFIAYAVSGGLLRGHHYAVNFNYPPEILARQPDLVTSITVNMAVALTPIAPKEQMLALDRPFGLWIGSEDELFEPEKVLAFADPAPSVKARSRAGAIAGEKHLSILMDAHKTIGPWIDDLLQPHDGNGD